VLQELVKSNEGINMSGGHFDYKQYQIEDIADEIEELIEDNLFKDEYGYCRNYSAETLDRFVEAVKALRIAEVYATRVDWLVSGDDGEDTFHQRLRADLSEIE
jgi:hypothetical protein